MQCLVLLNEHSMSVAILVLILVWIFFSAFKNPAYLFGPFLLMYGLEQWCASKIPFICEHSSYFNIAMISVLLISLRKRFQHMELEYFSHNRNLFITMALMTYAYFSFLWVGHEEIISEQWAKHCPYLMIYIFLFPMVISTSKDIDCAVQSILIYGIVVAALLLFSANWRINHIVTFAGGKQNYLELGFLGSILLFTASTYKGRVFGVYDFLMKSIGSILGLTLTYKSASRGHLCGAILIVLVSAVMMKNRKVFLLGLLYGLIVCIATLVFSNSDCDFGMVSRYTEEIVQTDRFTVFGDRLERWKYVANAWWGSEKWMTYFLGLGSCYSYTAPFEGYPHFVALEILTELGVLGFSLFMYLIFNSIMITREVIIGVRCDDYDKSRMLFISMLCLFLVLLSCKQGSMIRSSSLFGMIVLIGRLSVIYSNSNRIKQVVNSGLRII